MWNTARLAVAGRFDEPARHNNYRLTIHTRSRVSDIRPKDPVARVWVDRHVQGETGYGYWVLEEPGRSERSFLSFNRFLWLCWAAGRLACPENARPELTWLVRVAGGHYTPHAFHAEPTAAVPDLLEKCAALARRMAMQKPPQLISPAPADGAGRLQFETLRDAFRTRSVGCLDLNFELQARDLTSPEFAPGEDRGTESHTISGRMRLRSQEHGRDYVRTEGFEVSAWGEQEAYRLFIDLATHAARLWPRRLRPYVSLLPCRQAIDADQLDPLAVWLNVLWTANPENFTLAVFPKHRDWRYARWQGGNPFLASVLAIDLFVRGYSPDTAFDIDRQAVSQVPLFTLEDRAAAQLAVAAAHGRDRSETRREPPSPPREAAGYDPLQTLTPCERRAYQQCTDAESRLSPGASASDQELYDLCTSRLEGGETMPLFETWCRYVREGRRASGTGRNSRRAGRPVGGSVVRPDEV